MTAIHPAQALFIKAQATMNKSPIIRFPCRPHIARFITKLQHAELGDLIQLEADNLLGLTILAQTCKLEKYLETQKECSLDRFTDTVRFCFVHEQQDFYLTDQAVIKLNAYLQKWFVSFIEFQITALRTYGLSQKEIIDDIMNVYDISEEHLSSDAFKKISYRSRVRVGVLFTRGKIVK